jgi:hypothetical protein
MKKIYNRPVVNIVKLQLSHMIALSYTEQNATSGTVLSRRGGNDLWGDDDDDE